MEFRKMVMTTFYARQQKRHRCIGQSFGLCGRGRGWDDLGEWHWNNNSKFLISKLWFRDTDAFYWLSHSLPCKTFKTSFASKRIWSIPWGRFLQASLSGYTFHYSTSNQMPILWSSYTRVIYIQLHFCPEIWKMWHLFSLKKLSVISLLHRE